MEPGLGAYFVEGLEDKEDERFSQADNAAKVIR